MINQLVLIKQLALTTDFIQLQSLTLNLLTYFS